MRKPVQGRGHTYVLELSNGVVKVGFAGVPRIRLQKHARDLSKDGVSIVRQWVSPSHDEAGLNEEMLIAACEQLGGVCCSGREWFMGILFDDVVQVAQGAPCTEEVVTPTVPLEAARITLGEIVTRAMFAGTATIITRNGKPAARLVPVSPEAATAEEA